MKQKLNIALVAALIILAAWFVFFDKDDKDSIQGEAINASADSLIQREHSGEGRNLKDVKLPTYQGGENVRNTRPLSQASEGLSTKNTQYEQDPVRLGLSRLSEVERRSIEKRLEGLEGYHSDLLSEKESLFKVKPDEALLVELNGWAEGDDAYQLAVLSEFKGDCFRRLNASESQLCNELTAVYINEISIRKVTPIDRLDRLVLRGELQAQFMFHGALLSAVESFEMNTARDGELWLNRRQRMITYSLKFAQAGSVISLQQLAKLFDHSDYIKASPYWAAVFYKQLGRSESQWQTNYQGLVDKYELDVFEIESDREKMFD